MRLRTGVFVVLMLAIFVAKASAQQVMATYAVKGGVGIGSISSDFEENLPDSRTGVIFGAGVEIPYKMLSFVIEGLYNQMGATGSDPDVGDIEARINYLQIPFLAKFSFGTESNIKPFAYAGAAPAFTTSAKFKGGGEEEDIRDEVKSTDFSILFGGGVRFGQFAGEVRYGWGLMNINGNALESEINTRQIAILFSVLFGG